MKFEKKVWKKIDALLEIALDEDLGKGDITTECLIPEGAIIKAEWIARENCRLAGLPMVERIFKKLNPSIKTEWIVDEGSDVKAGKFGYTYGPAKGILRGERTALNFVQRLSGIATLTAAFVKKANPYHVKIYDTRKTTPTLRVLEKYAVRAGGGCNHRMKLDEMLLVKENHQRVMERYYGEDWAEIFRKIRKRNKAMKIGVEVENLKEFKRAVCAGVDFVLLDNMSPKEVRRIADEWKDKVLLEASGGIKIRNVEDYAKTGINRISIGSLTHSVRSIDISLEVVQVK